MYYTQWLASNVLYNSQLVGFTRGVHLNRPLMEMLSGERKRWASNSSHERQASQKQAGWSRLLSSTWLQPLAQWTMAAFLSNEEGPTSNGQLVKPNYQHFIRAWKPHNSLGIQNTGTLLLLRHLPPYQASHQLQQKQPTSSQLKECHEHS